MFAEGVLILLHWLCDLVHWFAPLLGTDIVLQENDPDFTKTALTSLFVVLYLESSALQRLF